jgi:hypothetical protein
MSHKVQIHFYTLCLQRLLPKPPFVFAGEAAVWLPSPLDVEYEGASSLLPGLKSLDVSHLSDSLDNFLFHQLPQLLLRPQKDVKWHSNPLCRDCPCDANCRFRAVSEGTLGSIPNISLDDASSLATLLDLSHARKLTDIEELHELFLDQGRVAVLQQSLPSAMKKAERILGISPKKKMEKSAVIEAAKTNTIQVSMAH